MQYKSGTSRWGPDGIKLAFLAGALGVAMLLATVALLLPTSTVSADHDSMYVVCPDPIREGNTGQMTVRKPGHRVLYQTVFTYNGDYTAGANDFKEYHGIRMESDSDENSLWIPAVTTEDTLAEHDETFSIGFWDGGAWHGCVVTIEDDDTPEITVVEISSTPVDHYAYRAGDAIDVTVNLDAKAEVHGTPLLSLYVGDQTGSNWRGAQYHSGSGTRSLVFKYRVQPHDLDLDGITVSAAASDNDGDPAYGFSGNIYAKGTDVPIDYAHSRVDGGTDHLVDGRPYVQKTRVTSAPGAGWSAYRANQTIEVSLTFDTDVVVAGEVTVGLSLGLKDHNWDEALRQASYLRGSGADTLVFGYTVAPGDMDPKGIIIATGKLLGNPLTRFGGSGAIKAKDADVEAHSLLPGTDRLPEHRVDAVPPTISAVVITSQPADGEAYCADEVVSVAVTFSEAVTARGDVRLDLDIGGTSRAAALSTEPERTFTDTLMFQYRIEEGDFDVDGVGIGANALKLNGGSIHDAAGNSAGLSHGVLVADSAHMVTAATSDQPEYLLARPSCGAMPPATDN